MCCGLEKNAYALYARHVEVRESVRFGKLRILTYTLDQAKSQFSSPVRVQDEM